MEATTLSIIVLVGIIYLLIIIGAFLFIINKRKGTFTQTIDPKPGQRFQPNEELKK
ncbi:hypothetical protein [Lysinibacillus sp. BW-2-10]|uniref:hypothetical protein n=1 Tax=Lysinibacillus sp. BW-2-10 TaxID=2590030 RepID=UPI0016425CF3|nr:hypothetical protein [Lysinibacillus sp. BW-2-10]